MPELRSSAIRRVFYLARRRELHVAFRESGDYVYFDVPPETYEALLAAPSKGRFVNEHVKGRFSCTRRRGPAGRRIWLDEPRWPRGGTSA